MGRPRKAGPKADPVREQREPSADEDSRGSDAPSPWSDKPVATLSSKGQPNPDRVEKKRKQKQKRPSETAEEVRDVQRTLFPSPPNSIGIESHLIFLALILKHYSR